MFSKALLFFFSKSLKLDLCGKGFNTDFMPFQKVSTRVSLRSPRRLTRVDTFYFYHIFCMSEDQYILWLGYFS